MDKKQFLSAAAAVAIVMAVITIAIAYAVQLHGMKDTLK